MLHYWTKLSATLLRSGRIRAPVSPLSNAYSLQYKSTEVPQSDGPVKFSESPAFKHKPELSFGGQSPNENTPKMQPYITMGSLAVFMLYFFILREENDIDQRIGGRTLEQELRQYEIDELKQAIEKCNRNNIDTQELNDRLIELTYLNIVPSASRQ